MSESRTTDLAILGRPNLTPSRDIYFNSVFIYLFGIVCLRIPAGRPLRAARALLTQSLNRNGMIAMIEWAPLCTTRCKPSRAPHFSRGIFKDAE
jgi:hypothetical protein